MTNRLENLLSVADLQSEIRAAKRQRDLDEYHAARPDVFTMSRTELEAEIERLQIRVYQIALRGIEAAQ